MLCLRLDIDTFSARTAYIAELGLGCYPYIPRLLSWAKDFGVPLQFCTCGMGLREFPREHRAIRDAGHPIDSHLYTHTVRLIDEPERVEEELVLTERTFAEHGQRWTGIGATGMYPNGIADRPDIQRLLERRGYQWVSSKYNLKQDVALAQMQPHWLTPSLLEIPCPGMSDRHCYDLKLPVEAFIEKVTAWLGQCAAENLVYVACLHPCVLAKYDPAGRFVPAVLARAADLKMPVVTIQQLRDAMGRRSPAGGAVGRH